MSPDRRLRGVCALQSNAADERAVGAPLVEEEVLAVDGTDGRMPRAHAGVREPDVCEGPPPEDDAVPVEGEPRRLDANGRSPARGRVVHEDGERHLVRSACPQALRVFAREARALVARPGEELRCLCDVLRDAASGLEHDGEVRAACGVA